MDTRPLQTDQSEGRVPLTFDGGGLSPDVVLHLAAGPCTITPGDAGLARVSAAHTLVEACSERRPVYGRTTGVGANRSVKVAGGNDQDLRLLRSHATGSGPFLPRETVRAAMIIRLNQLLRGGSGISAEAVRALAAAVGRDALPRVRRNGAIGTGDLNAFAEIALCMAGEMEYDDGSRGTLWQPGPGDGLPFISTNAMTVAVACESLAAARNWLQHFTAVACLSLIAVGGSMEPFAAAVHEARPQKCQAGVAARVRALLAGHEPAPARVQDSYGFRALTQVAAAMTHSLQEVGEALTVEMNASSENPLVSVSEADVFHNGNFHGLPIALALDHAKLAVASLAQLSLARLNNLSDPTVTGLQSFLAVGEAGSSGVMVLEYNASAALARLRNSAMPATVGSTVISRGTEDHASYSTQAAEQLGACVGSATQVLGAELVSAVRALAIKDVGLSPETELGRYLAQVREGFNTDFTDRPLGDDLMRAVGFLEQPYQP